MMNRVTFDNILLVGYDLDDYANSVLDSIDTLS
jgi:hypothetical protein